MGHDPAYSAGEWKVAQSSTSEFLHSVAMVSADEGWAVGDRGTILHFKNGDWEVAKSPTDHALRSISMVSSDEGWIVGDDIVLFYSP